VKPQFLGSLGPVGFPPRTPSGAGQLSLTGRANPAPDNSVSVAAKTR